MDAKELRELELLLSHGIDAASALKLHLGAERAALVAHDIAELETSVASKRESVAALGQFEASIRSILDRHSDKTSGQETDSWLDQAKMICPGYPELQKKILLLGDTLAECFRQSIENEGLVNLGLARVSKAIKMLEGSESSTSVYQAEAGMATSMPGPRTLARV